MAAGEVATPIEVRELDSVPDFREAVRLQKEIWGFDDIELLPLRLFVVAHKVGGQVLGAFDAGAMVGFLIAIPGVKHSSGGNLSFLHSHMMGVQAPYRNRGVGRMLKLAQRDDALARGIGLVEWTFDPLELKNAYFNIERLGAVVCRYVLNQYGSTSSPLHGGLPTDRCVAEWHLSSDRVERLLAGAAVPRAGILARVAVPTNIADLRRDSAARAREIQLGVSESFIENLRGGLIVSGFERGADHCSYLFSAVY